MNSLNRIALYIFSVFWVVVILLDYFQKHPLYFKSLNEFGFYDIMAVQVLLVGGISYYAYWKSAKQIKWITGGTIALVGFVFMGLYLWAYDVRLLRANNVTDISVIRVLGYNVFHIFRLFTVCLVSYLVGRGLINTLKLKMQKPPTIAISGALGVTIWASFTLLLSAFDILNIIVIWQGVVLVILWQRDRILPILRTLFLKPINIQSTGPVGLGLLFFIVFLVCFNFMHTGTLFPRGFDSQNFYANIPNLITDQKGLIIGFQPYAWSVFMASGQVMFSDISVSLGLSSMGGVLSLGALYTIGTYNLKTPVSSVLLVLLMVLLIPAFAVQMVYELKVDLGLLYIELSILILLVEWLKQFKEEKVNWHWKSFFTDKYLIVIGVLLGFALSIKLTAVFVVLAIPVILFVVRGTYRQALAAFLFVIGLMLLLNLDNVAGLGSFHRLAGLLTVLCPAVGIGLFAWEYKLRRVSISHHIKSLVIMGIFCAVTFSPWIIKNSSETDGSTVTELLNGKAPGINTSLDEMDRVYQKSLER